MLRVVGSESEQLWAPGGPARYPIEGGGQVNDEQRRSWYIEVLVKKIPQYDGEALQLLCDRIERLLKLAPPVETEARRG